MKARLLFLVACLLSAGLAQAQNQTLNPCISTGDPAEIEAGFLAAGWTALTDPARRELAAAALGEIAFVIRMLPPRAETVAEMDEFFERARRFGQNEFGGEALFERNGAYATFLFPRGFEVNPVVCQFSAMTLPEVTDALAELQPGENPQLRYRRTSLPILPFGIDSVDIDLIRFAPTIAPTQPPLAPDSLIVTVQRQTD